MNYPKFLNNQLVIFKDGIYEILSSTSDFHYKIILVAYLRNVTPDEFHKFITKPEEIIVEESTLERFDAKKPKFGFGEGVRLSGMNCIVVWIQYRDYKYYYSVKEKYSHDGSLSSYGWEKEESYLRKW